MEKITSNDIRLISAYAGKKYDKENEHDIKVREKLRAVYGKLEHLGKMLKAYGFAYDIKKHVLTPGGQTFQKYFRLHVFPGKEFKENCFDKEKGISYIIGLQDNLHFYITGSGKFMHATQEAGKESLKQINIDELNSYEDIIQKFIEFDKKYRKLLYETGAALGLSYCQNKWTE